MMPKPLIDKLQVWGFENDFVLFRDGSIGFALELTAIDASCWEDHKVNSLHDKMRTFLNGLPKGIGLQFVQDLRPTKLDILERHESLSDPDASGLAKGICKERVERLAALNEDGALPQQFLKLFIRKPSPRSLISKFGLLSRSEK